MIDLRKALHVNGLSNSPGEFSETLRVVQLDLFAVLFHEKKPIAAPRDIAGDFTNPGHINNDGLYFAIARHILHRYRAIIVQPRRHHAHAGVDAMLTRFDATQMRERRNQPNRSMPAHPEVADIVKKNHADVA